MLVNRTKFSRWGIRWAAKCFKEFVDGNRELIDSAINRGWLVIPIAEGRTAFGVEVPRPSIDQELGMGGSHAEILGISHFQEFRLFAQGVSQDGIDQRPNSCAGKFHCFENSRVLWSLKKKQLVDAEAQQIACVVIEVTGAERLNPEIEQSQVAEDSVEKFRDECAIRRP